MVSCNQSRPPNRPTDRNGVPGIPRYSQLTSEDIGNRNVIDKEEFSCFLGISEFDSIQHLVLAKQASLALEYKGAKIFCVEDVRAVNISEGTVNKNASSNLTKVERHALTQVDEQKLLLLVQPKHHTKADRQRRKVGSSAFLLRLGFSSDVWVQPSLEETVEHQLSGRRFLVKSRAISKKPS